MATNTSNENTSQTSDTVNKRQLPYLPSLYIRMFVRKQECKSQTNDKHFTGLDLNIINVSDLNNTTFTGPNV